MRRLPALRFLLTLWRDERGSVAIHIGIFSIVLIGMTSLGIETGTLYLKQRGMQAAADAAAVSAALARATGRPADYRVEAEAVASTFGYRQGTNGTTITVNSPPSQGSYAGDVNAVEVIMSQPQNLSLVRAFHSGTFRVGARAVAGIGGGPAYCVLQLDGTAVDGFYMDHGAAATLENCGIAVDSSDAQAFVMAGGARLYAPNVSVVGDASVSQGARIDPDEALKTGQPIVLDPYATVPVPSFSGCGNGDGRSYGNGQWVLTPGVFCNGVQFQHAAQVTMQPGIYVVDRGTFDVGGGVKLSGDGVTIVLTNSTGGTPATVNIDHGADVELAAPTTGPTAGIIFFGDRLVPGSHDINYFRGGASLSLVGAIYFPTAAVEFDNGASNVSACTQLIAGTIELQGGARFRNDCPPGVLPIVGGAGGGGASQLVE